MATDGHPDKLLFSFFFVFVVSFTHIFFLRRRQEKMASKANDVEEHEGEDLVGQCKQISLVPWQYLLGMIHLVVIKCMKLAPLTVDSLREGCNLGLGE